MGDMTFEEWLGDHDEEEPKPVKKRKKDVKR
jgi:hypothetical protein